MKRRILFVLLAFTMLLTGTAFAQTEAAEENVFRYTGTVQAINEMTITLLVDEAEMEFTLTEETVFSFERGMRGEKPEGRMPAGEMPDGMPKGNVPDKKREAAEGVIPEMPGNGTENGFEELPEMAEGGFGVMELSIENIVVGDKLTVETDADGNVTAVYISGVYPGKWADMPTPEPAEMEEP